MPLPIYDEHYWNDRWRNAHTQWDIGYAALALMEYTAKLTNKKISILIPGCGNAYEVDELLAQGYENITIIDFAEAAVTRLQERFNAQPFVRVVNADFFEWIGSYDLILEQTFFCALGREQRQKYAAQMSQLLSDQGKLVGVLFNRIFNYEGPPFGGNEQEYRELFEPYFEIETMNLCYNSINERAGKELFIQLKKKTNAR